MNQPAPHTDLLYSTLDNMLEGVQIIGFDYRYLYVNDSVAKQGKSTKGNLTGKTMMDCYPGIENTHIFQCITRSLRERIHINLENKFEFPDKSVSWFELSIQPVAEGVCILSIDTTKRKEAQFRLEQNEKQLRFFSRHLTQSIEEDRSRIAREIHDELGQHLAGIKIALSLLKNDDSQHNADINRIMENVDEAIQSMRKVATQLRPGILDSLGLIPSIQWLGEQFEKKTGIKCHSYLLHKPETTAEIDKTISTEVFRICQEALTNVSKHANASEVLIHIDQTEKELTLKISDNGQGIAHEKIENPFSMGLLGMRERATLIGADLKIRSEKGRETTIQLNVPVSVV